MKKSVIVSGIIVLCSIGYAFNYEVGKILQADKKLKVEFTISEWEAKLQWMQICQEVMRKSSLPGHVISQYQDSLSMFMNETVKQLQAQMPKDTSKPKK